MPLLIKPDSWRRLRWKNGLGSTLEIASDAASPGGEWTWRLSIADVPGRVPFSVLPGVDRLIACLFGAGLRLERQGRRDDVPREGAALPFAGEEPVTGDPLGPGVRDVNLMLRRGRCSGRMTLIRGGAFAARAPVLLLHAAQASSSLRLRVGGQDIELGPGDTLVASGEAAIPETPGSALVACEITGDGVGAEMLR